MTESPTGKHIIGSHIDLADKHGETALHYAARHGHVGVLSLLLASRADTRAIGTHGEAAEVRPQAHMKRSLTPLSRLHSSLAACGCSIGGEAGRPHRGSRSDREQWIPRMSDLVHALRRADANHGPARSV
jgi:ankyrin repeat protein